MYMSLCHPSNSSQHWDIVWLTCEHTCPHLFDIIQKQASHLNTCAHATTTWHHSILMWHILAVMFTHLTASQYTSVAYTWTHNVCCWHGTHPTTTQCHAWIMCEHTCPFYHAMVPWWGVCVNLLASVGVRLWQGAVAWHRLPSYHKDVPMPAQCDRATLMEICMPKWLWHRLTSRCNSAAHIWWQRTMLLLLHPPLHNGATQLTCEHVCPCSPPYGIVQWNNLHWNTGAPSAKSEQAWLV